MQVSEIKPFGKRIDLVIRVEEKGEPREVTGRLDSTSHKVAEALVGDESGCILLTLWDDAIDSVQPGKTYKIANGYASTFKNSVRLNIGRYGKMEEASEEIGQINKENNLSEKDISAKVKTE
ncbi:MAG: single-stranded DNA-binding protein [Candidatus Diapherotrites archaeon]|nr:single-stranded DNA-binding protein [Candidatus Diapherotrites archaeon]